MSEDYSYFQDKEFLSSLAAYERMRSNGEPIELEPEMLTDIAEYYAMNQRMDEADRCIEYAVSFYPDSVDPQIFLARQQMFYGNQEEAWRICNAITDQSDREVIFLRSELYMYFNESQKAFALMLENYKKADDEDAPEFLYDCICQCKDYGFGDKAMEWVEMLRSDYPDYIDAIALQAEIHNYRREYQQTIDLLTDNIELMPYCIHAWLQLAEAYLWLEEYDEAMEASEYALAIDSDNAEAIFMHANILLDTEHLDEAHEYYTRFLRYFPYDERANYFDAECLFDNKQYEEAIARYERLLSLPGYAMKGYALSYIAYCHAQLGHNEQALHYRQQAEKERTNNLHELFPDLYSAEDYRNTLLNNPPSPEDSTNELPF